MGNISYNAFRLTYCAFPKLTHSGDAEQYFLVSHNSPFKIKAGIKHTHTHACINTHTHTHRQTHTHTQKIIMIIIRRKGDEKGKEDEGKER